MPSKRRNNGRGKKNKGNAIRVHCINCARITPKVFSLSILPYL